MNAAKTLAKKISMYSILRVDKLVAGSSQALKEALSKKAVPVLCSPGPLSWSPWGAYLHGFSAEHLHTSPELALFQEAIVFALSAATACRCMPEQQSTEGNILPACTPVNHYVLRVGGAGGAQRRTRFLHAPVFNCGAPVLNCVACTNL
eukprot:1136902-Pelagomonas_calceolata.AAC.2